MAAGACARGIVAVVVGSGRIIGAGILRIAVGAKGRSKGVGTFSASCAPAVSTFPAMLALKSVRAKKN